MGRKPADDSDGEFSVLEYFIVESDEEGADIFCLSQMAIELLVQRAQNRGTNPEV